MQRCPSHLRDAVSIQGEPKVRLKQPLFLQNIHILFLSGYAKSGAPEGRFAFPMMSVTVSLATAVTATARRS